MRSCTALRWLEQDRNEKQPTSHSRRCDRYEGEQFSWFAAVDIPVSAERVDIEAVLDAPANYIMLCRGDDPADAPTIRVGATAPTPSP
jgi:hypothetical protein